MTTGDNSKSGNITYYNTKANSLGFIELSSHEVGHYLNWMNMEVVNI